MCIFSKIHEAWFNQSQTCVLPNYTNWTFNGLVCLPTNHSQYRLWIMFLESDQILLEYDPVSLYNFSMSFLAQGTHTIKLSYREHTLLLFLKIPLRSTNPREHTLLFFLEDSRTVKESEIYSRCSRESKLNSCCTCESLIRVALVNRTNIHVRSTNWGQILLKNMNWGQIHFCNGN